MRRSRRKELDPQKRKQIAHQMQELFYTEAPYIVLDYPKSLQAWNTDEWEGWKRIPQPNGAVSYISDNVSVYSRVEPKAAATETSSGGSSTTWIVVAVAAVVVVLVIVLLMIRRRPRAEEG